MYPAPAPPPAPAVIALDGDGLLIGPVMGFPQVPALREPPAVTNPFPPEAIKPSVKPARSFEEYAFQIHMLSTVRDPVKPNPVPLQVVIIQQDCPVSQEVTL
jgi:hypothetical protein